VLSKRLKQLRLAKGLSLESLAEAMGGIVTKQALSKYERDKAMPTIKVMKKLASSLNVKPAFLLTAPEYNISFAAYRAKSKLTKKSQESIQNLVAYSLEERLKLQELIAQDQEISIPINNFVVKNIEDCDIAADKMRIAWNLGSGSLDSIVNILEDHFVHVIEIESEDAFDGLSATALTIDGQISAAAVVTRKHISGGRQRLNLTHELGHLVLDVDPGVDEEKAAFRFASAFLAPADNLINKIGVRRSHITLDELLLYKKIYGMSLQAILYRLKDLEIINSSTYKNWCIKINQMGFRKTEPAELEYEEPQWLKRSVYRALVEGLISKGEAESLLNKPVDIDQSVELKRSRAFRKLSIEERRVIMKEQAERDADKYLSDPDWLGLQGGDLIEEI
jgi:Zn-dependent peptidase ImmA (M78 family)